MNQRQREADFEFGGLRFDVSFRGPGVTTRVDGEVNGTWQELLRFDDFVGSPHFHAPASGPPIPFDREAHGDPMEWFVAQIRDHLPEWLTRAGFGDVVPAIDPAAIAAHIDQISEAMRACLPEGFTRVPGIGLQRVPA